MISKKLSEMEEQQLHSNDERGRLRTENAVLTERVHVLEEQMLVAEQRYGTRFRLSCHVCDYGLMCGFYAHEI